MTTSQACVPLVTCPEASPLIGALLQRSVACVRADLSEDFLRALSAAYSRYWKFIYPLLAVKAFSRTWDKWKCEWSCVINHLSAAVFSSKCCELDEEAVISLWYHSLPSLEEAVLSLLESVLTATQPTPLTLQPHVEQSLLVGNISRLWGCAYFEISWNPVMTLLIFSALPVVSVT